ncbi:MAG TPA: hypothetical protein VF593_04275 [Chthoniobacteraceae bacterium]|jgi:hypothetical protein
MKHPIYTALGALLCAYLVTANLRGWSLFHTLSPTRLLTGGRATHK